MGSVFHTSAMITEPLKRYFSVFSGCLENYKHDLFKVMTSTVHFLVLQACKPKGYGELQLWIYTGGLQACVLLLALFPKEGTNPTELTGGICLHSII